MGQLALVLHAPGDESLAEKLAAGIRGFGYDVWHTGDVFVGEQIAEEVSKRLLQNGPVIICGTAKAAGSRWLRRVLGALNGPPEWPQHVRVFPVRMDADAYLDELVFGSHVAECHPDFEVGLRHLSDSLRKYFPILEGKDSTVDDAAVRAVPGVEDFDSWLTGLSHYSPQLLTNFRAELRPHIRASLLQDELDDTEFLVRAGLMLSGKLFAAAVLFLCDHPHIVVPTAYVQCVKYAGVDLTTTPDSREYYGPITSQIQNTVTFVTSEIRKAERVQPGIAAAQLQFEYPMTCLREVIANALCHRDYNGKHQQTSVRLFSDRIEVLSPGRWGCGELKEGLAYSLTDLASNHVCRNTRLARALGWIRMVETQGSGIPKAVRDCVENNSPVPSVISRDNAVTVTIFRRRDWEHLIGQNQSILIRPTPAGPTTYLCDLLTKTAFIDIRGLQVGKGQAHRFPIEDLYISLTTALAPPGLDAGKLGSTRRPDEKTEAEFGTHADRVVDLQSALWEDRLVVVGDPGAGKTTFLRRIAHAFCQTMLGDQPDAAQVRLGIADRTFPVFIRLSELAQHIQRHSGRATAPGSDDAPAWLPHHLATASADNGWGLEAEYFRDQLEGGRCTVLLDGLDEAPDRIVRKRISRLIENAANTYKGCRFVVTSRPAAYAGEVILLDFTQTRIDPLSDEAVETFLSYWCMALYVESREAAQEHCRELLAALRRRPDIRRMARNPVMLTALAVVHWNERRLPEQRADLYASIIHWLSRSREQKPGREKAERSVVLLQELALLMQGHPEGMKIQVPKRWAAEQLATEWGAEVDGSSIGNAEAFLDAEELDSGIVVARGSDVQFWHRTFQEFLAARAICSRTDAAQHALLWGPPSRLYLPEWREVVLLLVGVLHGQGRAKVDDLVRTMLASLGPQSTLAERARCAGLLGAMLRDLTPVDYQPPDGQYRDLLTRVMAIFDRDRSQGVPIETRLAAADALGQAGDGRIDFNLEDYWTTMPSGTFLMGAQSIDPDQPNYDTTAQERESPVHQVHLETFRIARYPVTVGQYLQFLEDDGYQGRRWWNAGGFGKFSEPGKWEDQLQYPSRPVVHVSWWEAVAFCAWASCRLPTEAEWERVARGAEGRKYPWGNDLPDSTTINYTASNIGHPTPVGIFPTDVTPEGIFDLAGNVWDWCADWREPYLADTVSNPAGEKTSASRAIRGGSWRDDADLCRAACRGGDVPWRRDGALGFRVAADAPGVQPRTGQPAEPGA